MRKLVVAIVLTVFAATAGVRAQNYPSHPITVVVALPAGGAVDALARALADEDSSRSAGRRRKHEWSRWDALDCSGVRSAPDGYTIGMGTLGQYVVSAAVYTLPFDVFVDLTPVVLLPSVPYWMVARKSLPPNTLQELVTYLKANPDKISATSVGTASLARFCGMFFQKQTGTSFQFVPYRGGAAALQDLVGGQIDLSSDVAANSLSQLRDGNIKAYAVMSKTRWFAAPEVPTADEAGVPGLYISTWHGFWAPKGTPEAIVAKLNGAALAAMADPTVGQRIADLGMDLPPRELQAPAAFAAFHKTEVEKWFPIVKAAGIKAE
jgi:tripartite-type tricarboxylate transporter receptor subunit TctC